MQRRGFAQMLIYYLVVLATLFPTDVPVEPEEPRRERRRERETDRDRERQTESLQPSGLNSLPHTLSLTHTHIALCSYCMVNAHTVFLPPGFCEYVCVCVCVCVCAYTPACTSLSSRLSCVCCVSGTSFHWTSVFFSSSRCLKKVQRISGILKHRSDFLSVCLFFA